MTEAERKEFDKVEDEITEVICKALREHGYYIERDLLNEVDVEVKNHKVLVSIECYK